MNKVPSADLTFPLRVTIVQPALPKYRIAVFRELSNRPGIDLSVVYGKVKGLNNTEPVGFKGIPSRRWEWKLAVWTTMIQWAEWTYCSRRRSDVVVLRWSPRSVVVWLAALRARFSSIPLVLWGHGYSKRERSWWSKLRDWQAALATAVVFYDPKTRDAYVSKGWISDRLFVALNTIDRNEIEAARRWWLDRPEQLEQFRIERDLNQGPVILFVSRLAPANRVDMLIQATAGLVADFPGLRTVIIGNGAAEKDRLQVLAKELGIGNNVVFENGIYDESRLAPWFLSASVFCYPANIGLSLIHAFAYALPVVTSNNMETQNPEIVALNPGVNGAVYVHQNLDSLIDVLHRIISDDAERQAMARAAYQTLESRFTLERMVDGLEQAIRFAHDSVSSPH